jgi:hypothetical protein
MVKKQLADAVRYSLSELNVGKDVIAEIESQLVLVVSSEGAARGFQTGLWLCTLEDNVGSCAFAPVEALICMCDPIACLSGFRSLTGSDRKFRPNTEGVRWAESSSRGNL